MKLDNTVSAVVTGGASGLGAATARALAAKGVKVAIFDLQAEKGEEVAREIGGVFCEVNVTDDASVDAGFAKAREAGTMSAAQMRPVTVLPADYLLAHQEYAPANALQGVGPYLRDVAASTPVRAPAPQ